MRLSLAAAILITTSVEPAFAQAAKPVIETASKLPRRAYVLPRTPTAMLDDPAALRELASAVDRDAADTLARYDIRDGSARRQLLGVRMSAALLLDDLAAAARFDAAAAVLQDKDALRRTANLESTGWLAASRVGDERAAHRAFQQEVARALAALPPATVRARIVEIRREIDLTSPAYARGEIATYADRVYKPELPMDGDFAQWLIAVAADEKVTWRFRPDYRAALTDWLRAHPAGAGADIWKARSVTLGAADGLTPIGVSVWDVGVDRAVFNAANQVAPTLAFDTQWNAASGDLKPVDPSWAPKRAIYERYMRGRGALSEGRDDADADFARRTIAALKTPDIEAFENGFQAYRGYIHGTHVAGIALAGDPAIKLVPVRVTWSDDPIPPPFDEAHVARMLAAARASIAYMRANGVRVTNMSWGVTGENIDRSLAANNVEPDSAKRTRRAQAIFDTLFTGMSAEMASAPEILFVIAAGNANQDLDFVRDMPGSINLPNVISIGAVDQVGLLTSFASTGKSIDLYALGYNVTSFVPGGGKVSWSGASLSAPQVVNAAAKMLTLDPTLTTKQVVAILRETATPSAEGLPLLNTRAAVEKVRAERVGAGSRTQPPTDGALGQRWR